MIRLSVALNAAGNCRIDFPVEQDKLPNRSMELNTLATLQDGEPPISRLSDAETARTMLQQLILDDTISSEFRAEVDGMVDLNAPYDQQELEDNGLGDNCNVNWGEVAARIEEQQSLYYDMLTAAPQFVSIDVEYGRRDNRQNYGQIMAEEAHRTIIDEGSFLYWMKLSQLQMSKHGMGPLIWQNGFDFRPRAIKRRRVLCPFISPSYEQEMEVVFIRDRMYPDQLWKYIQDPEIAARSKWNVEAVKNAIVECQVTDSRSSQRRTDFEFIQEQIKANAFGYRATSKIIEVSTVLVKEFTGRISQHVFCEMAESGSYLYSKIGKYSEMSEAICLMFYNIGNGDFHSVRGQGTTLQRFGEASNRLLNRAMDNALQSSCTIWQAATPGDVQKLQFVEVGPNKIIPPGLKEVQREGAPQIMDSVMKVASFFKMQQRDSTGASNAAIRDENNTRISAREIEADETHRAQIGNSRGEHYLLQLDVVYRNMVNRLTNLNLLETDPGGKLALEFQKRCKRRGVPEAAFKKIVNVRATRTIGFGSPSARVQSLNQLGQFFSRMPEEKQKVYVRDSIGAITQNNASIDRYGPDLDEDENPTRDVTEAVKENTDFYTGASVGLPAQDMLYFNPDQNHLIHATIHIKFGFEIAQRVQGQQMNPMQASAVFEGLSANTIQHLQAMEADPTRRDVFKQVNQQFSELMKMSDSIKRAAAEIQDQQQQPQQQNSQDMEAQAEIARKNAITQNDIENKTKKTDHSIALANDKAVHKKALDDATTAHKLALENQTA